MGAVTVRVPSMTRRRDGLPRDLLLCFVLAIVPLLWRAIVGEAVRPNDDSWAYERILRTFITTNSIELIDWNDITLVGVLPIGRLWSELFGFGTVQLRLLGSVMAFLALVGLRSILVQLGAGHIPLAIACMGVASGFMTTTGTFMADNFALAPSLWAVSVTLTAIGCARAGQHWRSLMYCGLGAMLAFSAFSVRQQAVSAAVVVVVLLLRYRTALLHGWAVFVAIYALVAGGFYIWRSSLEYGGGVNVAINSRLIVTGGVVMVATLMFTVTPLLLWGFSYERFRRYRSLRLAAVVCSIGIIGVAPLRGRVDDYSSVLRHASEHPISVWFVVALAASVAVSSAVLLASALGASGGVTGADSDSALGAIVAGFVATLSLDLVSLLLSSTYYSRYSLFSTALLLAALALALRMSPSTQAEPAEPLRRAVGWGGLGILAVANLWAFDASIAPARALEEAAELAQCAGIPPEEVDAGIPWMGSYATGNSVSQFRTARSIVDGLPATEQRQIFPDAVRNAVVLDADPVDAANIAGEVVAVGPFVSTGILPGTSAQRWMFVREQDVDAIKRCVELNESTVVIIWGEG